MSKDYHKPKPLETIVEQVIDDAGLLAVFCKLPNEDELKIIIKNVMEVNISRYDPNIVAKAAAEFD